MTSPGHFFYPRKLIYQDQEGSSTPVKPVLPLRQVNVLTIYTESNHEYILSDLTVVVYIADWLHLNIFLHAEDALSRTRRFLNTWKTGLPLRQVNVPAIYWYWWRRRTAGHANHSQSFNPNDYRVQIRKEPAVNRARWSHSQSKDDMFGDDVTRSLQGRPVKYNFGAKFPTDRNQTLTLYEADVTNETTRKIWFWSLAKLPTQRSYRIG